MQILKEFTKCLVTKASVIALSVGLMVSPSWALSLKDAVSVAVDSNPEIGEAIENREAHEFELRQARGFALPSVDVEASAGKRLLDDRSRRRIGTDDDPLFPAYGEVVVTQKLFDGGRIRAEVDFQASTVDSASFRVLERSEYIGLQVVREYLEYMLQAEIVSLSAKNLREVRGIASKVSSSISGGALTEADRQQADERVLGARSRLQEAEEELSAAEIRFNSLVGLPLTRPSMPASVAKYLPKSLDEAIGLGRTNNPRVHMAKADIDKSDANVAEARADFLPEIVAEGRARTGQDIDGSEGRTTDLLGRVVLRWNVYKGGIKKANEQEQIRRASEQRMIMHQINRDIEQAVRTSWDRRDMQYRLADILNQQARENVRLVGSYREQFSVGQRSLLDVLDAQNTSYNVEVRSRTALYAARFAEYRLLAATGKLLNTMGVQPPEQAEAYARVAFGVPETLPAEIYKRVPPRQYNDIPLDLLAPIRKR